MPKLTSDLGWNLVGDVGGTHARFALCKDTRALEKISVLDSADFSGIDLAIKHYLRLHGQPKINQAAVGMANPVTGDHVTMTNLPWTFSIEETRNTLGLNSLHIINDFAALALSIPLLPLTGLIKMGGQSGVPDTPLAVLGPGTGLGISALIPTRHKGWVVIAGEGGHADFAPGNERELTLWREAQHQFGHVSREHLLSGPGLEFIYQIFSRLTGKPIPTRSAAEIGAQAINDTCALCRESLDTFCAILGAVAADTALTLGARGGVYIGGGIVPKLGDYFLHSPFRSRFESKGRLRSYLEPIPVFLITDPYAALLGAAAYLDTGVNDKRAAD
ncbi:MAG: glucokinase [Burkholderiaceae bacterium]